MDGVKVKNPNPFLFPANNWGLCDVKNLSNGSHVITLNITTTGRPFYLDRIRYTPTTNLENPPTNQSLLIRYTDSRISYDSNWKDSNLGGMATSQMGASMVFSFFGEKISFISAQGTKELIITSHSHLQRYLALMFCRKPTGAFSSPCKRKLFD